MLLPVRSGSLCREDSLKSFVIDREDGGRKFQPER